MSKSIVKTLSELRHERMLPAMSGVALSLLEASKLSDISISQVCTIVMPDPVLTAKLIKMANSSLYGSGRAISSIREAVSRIGMSNVKTISLVMSLMGFQKMKSHSFDYGLFWRQSIFLACLLRKIGSEAKLGITDELFTLGLLNNIGLLVFCEAFPDKHAPWPGEILNAARNEVSGVSSQWLSCNKQYDSRNENDFGFTSYELTSELLNEWGLPKDYSEASALVNTSIPSPFGRSERLAKLISRISPLSMTLAYLSGRDLGYDSDIEQAFHNICREYEIAEDKIAPYFQQICENATDWMSNLDLPLPFEARIPNIIEDIPLPVNQESNFSILYASSCNETRKLITETAWRMGGTVSSLPEGGNLSKVWVDGNFDGLVVDAPSSPEMDRYMEALSSACKAKGCYFGIITQNYNDILKNEHFLTSGGCWLSLAPAHKHEVLSFVSAVKSIADIRISTDKVEAEIRGHILNLETANSKMEKLVFSDSMTGLPNRKWIVETLVKKSKLNEDTLLVSLDITDFGTINVEHGSMIGDALLFAIRDRLLDIFGKGHVARLGGNEFGLLLPRNQYSLSDLEKKCFGIFEKPFEVYDGGRLEVTATFGAAEWPGVSRSPEEVLSNSESALSANKRDTREGIRFYDAGFEKRRKEKARMEQLLRHALENRELRLAFQPRVDIVTGKMEGAEALMRWTSPELGEVSPIAFIPVAEEFGLIGAMGDWAIGEALRLSKPILRFLPDFKIAVNISSRQLRKGGIASNVLKHLKDCDLPSSFLELEITESCAMENPEIAERELSAIKEIGCFMALDDFGTGHSSLSRLKRLPLDCLKIDRSFVKDTPADKEDVAICKMVTDLSRTLGLDVVAEGVETHEQAVLLAQMGVKWAQGYYFAKPESIKTLITWASRGGILPQKI